MVHYSSLTHSFSQISYHWTSQSLVIINVVFTINWPLDDMELSQSEFMPLLITALGRYQYLCHLDWFHICGLMSPTSVSGLREGQQYCGDARLWQVMRGVMFQWVRVGCSSLIRSSFINPFRWNRPNRFIFALVLLDDWPIEY